ncbi:MAG TPA: twin-arginine translocation signal domain-containing protein [Haliangium sp.]|nr:twin-arginine translocation signal domain-containing protein [Haliangium sp.]
MLIRRWNPSRRDLLRAGAAGTAALLLGSCGADASGRPSTMGEAAPMPEPTPECLETEDNILGPYWLDGAPARSDLTEPGLAGTRLQITGRVLGLGAAACTPLAGALLDVWQSDDRGDTPADYSDGTTWRLRGRLYTAADGSYDLRTIVPGRYLNGDELRPAHIHVRVSAPGHRLLTTQLYFAGDPYNDTDAFIRESLIMTLADAGDGKAASFDFVIPAA